MPINNIVASVSTPAFIYDEHEIKNNIDLLKDIGAGIVVGILFPLKPFSFFDGLKFIGSLIQGFSTSSVFEAKLAREVLGPNKPIHLTTPGLSANDIEIISNLCDFVSFNSLSQLKSYHQKFGSTTQLGLRINPEISFLKDKRYDPCKKNSKLGVPLAEVLKHIGESSFQRLAGIHFHNNCESVNFCELLDTVQYIENTEPKILSKIKWINLGGGYLFNKSLNTEVFLETIQFLKRRYNLQVFIEPGKSIVGNAGYIISSVVDLFRRGRLNIAVLDTTVNHMPEVFEYQYRPSIEEEKKHGKYIYQLVGCSCLAGDLFGTYRFEEPLEIGSRVSFKNMGAYTMVKAHMFNGINLPNVYAYTLASKLELKMEYSYEDFALRVGVKNNAAL